MAIMQNVTDVRNVGPERTRGESSLLLDVGDVSRLLKCSPRHIWRLADAGKMPKPYKVGALCRWDRSVVEGWIANGCPACSQENGGAE